MRGTRTGGSLYQPVTSKQVLHRKQARSSKSRSPCDTGENPGAESYSKIHEALWKHGGARGRGLSSSRPDWATQRARFKKQTTHTEDELEAEQTEEKKHPLFFTFCLGALSAQPSPFPSRGFLDRQRHRQ